MTSYKKIAFIFIVGTLNKLKFVMIKTLNKQIGIIPKLSRLINIQIVQANGGFVDFIKVGKLYIF